MDFPHFWAVHWHCYRQILLENIGKVNISHHGSFISVPASACVSANQLQNFGNVADRSICDDEDLPRMRALHGLLVHPGERPQQVGAAHVSSHPLYVLTRLHQSDLQAYEEVA